MTPTPAAGPDPQVETFLEPGVAANVIASYMAYTVGKPKILDEVFRGFAGQLVDNLAKQGYALVALHQEAPGE